MYAWLAVWLLMAPQDAATHLKQGTAHLQRNEIDSAVRELTRAVVLNPKSAIAHLLLGQAYLAKGAAEFVAEAKGEFQQARELDPAQPLASFYIAKIDLDLGRLLKAEQELRRAMKAHPTASYLTVLMGEVRRKQGDAAEAVRIATGTLRTAPQNEQDAIPALYFRALAYWDLRQEAEALSDLRRAISSPFATPDMYRALGSIHLDRGRLVEAEAALRKSIEMAPGAEGRLRLAQTLHRQGKREEALRELRLVEAAPQLSSEYFQQLMADAAFEEGLITGAREAFQRALDLNPQHEEARRRLNAVR